MPLPHEKDDKVLRIWLHVDAGCTVLHCQLAEAFAERICSVVIADQDPIIYTGNVVELQVLLSFLQHDMCLTAPRRVCIIIFKSCQPGMQVAGFTRACQLAPLCY
jgi:hypothetical protein